MRLRFDCALRVLPEAIEIAWSIVNQEPHDVGLFDRIPAVLPDGTYRFSPDTCWVEVDPARGLYVRRCALPIPRGLSPDAYVPPLCSRIAAGAAYHETVRLPLPVPEMQPFKRSALVGPTPGEVVADVPASVSRVTFEIGAFPVAASVSLTADHPAFPGVLTATLAAVAHQELLARAFHLAAPVAALGYRVAPWP